MFFKSTPAEFVLLFIVGDSWEGAFWTITVPLRPINRLKKQRKATQPVCKITSPMSNKQYTANSIKPSVESIVERNLDKCITDLYSELEKYIFLSIVYLWGN